MTAKYHGNTHLYDAGEGVVLHGFMHVATDPSGRSEIRIRNDSTKVERVLVFTSPEVRDCVTQFITTARHVYQRVEVPVEVHAPVCPACQGARHVEDVEGNWVTCQQCA